ncbi:MAG: hypothetical protein KME46_06980 [Brasilonema angustatum HA4187-MV1]|nr:hypothetical protein [Brasilonema angustatum HA4187-MV1]
MRYKISKSHFFLRLIEWMMVLPEALEGSFKEELRRTQEGNRMPYITGFERDGMVKNARESVIEVLETRFEVVPAQLSVSAASRNENRLEEIKDIAVLKRLHKQSITIASIQEFERLLDEIQNF